MSGRAARGLLAALGSVVLLAGLLTLTGARAAAPQAPPCRALAHRGAHGPGIDENTAEAAAEAARLGAWTDADLRVTTDHVAVLMHDRDVRRTTDGSGRVEDHDYAWVSRLRTEPSGQAVPTWEDYLEAAGSAPVVAELKMDVADWTHAEVQAVVDAAAGQQVYLGGTPSITKRLRADGAALYWRADADQPLSLAEAGKRGATVVLTTGRRWTAPMVRRFERHGYTVGVRNHVRHSDWPREYAAGVRLFTVDAHVARFNRWCRNQGG